MRAILVVVSAASTIGCASTLQTSRGVTRDEFKGAVSVVFTNASPERMCELHMNADSAEQFGDNWLPDGGLAVGTSADFKIRPGVYKATWSTCRRGPDGAWFAGTLTHETSFEIREATQLFAFVADSVAPTQRAAPRDFHRMVKFPGQQIGGPVVAVAPAAPQPTSDKIARTDERVPQTATEREPSKTSLRDFVDYKAAYKNTANKKLRPKASIKRAHDITSERTGYVRTR